MPEFMKKGRDVSGLEGCNDRPPVFIETDLAFNGSLGSLMKNRWIFVRELASVSDS